MMIKHSSKKKYIIVEMEYLRGHTKISKLDRIRSEKMGIKMKARNNNGKSPKVELL